MLRDPQEHLMVGFGQWEFITSLGPRLGGEARIVHALFMETWDFEDDENPLALEGVDAERRRQLWRLYQRENVDNLTLRAQSSFHTQPLEPNELELRDMERFFAELEARFRSLLRIWVQFKRLLHW